ncbi:hypothetical protein [Deinococcus sp.]|uniref:hypothetical protein n=1 Tax=Deinococcus sp. TaxID=47478 RepID=UPI003C7B33BB
MALLGAFFWIALLLFVATLGWMFWRLTRVRPTGREPRRPPSPGSDWNGGSMDFSRDDFASGSSDTGGADSSSDGGSGGDSGGGSSASE